MLSPVPEQPVERGGIGQPREHVDRRRAQGRVAFLAELGEHQRARLRGRVLPEDPRDSPARARRRRGKALAQESEPARLVETHQRLGPHVGEIRIVGMLAVERLDRLERTRVAQEPQTLRSVRRLDALAVEPVQQQVERAGIAESPERDERLLTRRTGVRDDHLREHVEDARIVAKRSEHPRTVAADVGVLVIARHRDHAVAQRGFLAVLRREDGLAAILVLRAS